MTARFWLAATAVFVVSYLAAATFGLWRAAAAMTAAAVTAGLLYALAIVAVAWWRTRASR